MEVNRENMKNSFRGSCFDEDLVVEIAKKYNLKLPVDLREYYEDDAKDIIENEMPQMSQTELKETYDCILECLDNAYEKTILALRLSISDVGSDKRSISVLKHVCLMEAEPFVEEARMMLEEIESQVQDKRGIQDIRLNMGKRIVFADIWSDGFLLEWMIQRRIRKMLGAFYYEWNRYYGTCKDF